MYAAVIVNHNTRAVDRVFDYEIPVKLLTIVKPGVRVIVPFSKGNIQIEGFVLYIKEHTDAEAVKSIISASEQAFKTDMVPLIEYMHKRCLATYLDIIHTMIPSGTAVKTVEWITMQQGTYNGKSNKDKKILQLLNDNGGGMDLYALRSYFDTDIRARLKILEGLGLIKREFKHFSGIGRKTIRAVRITADDHEINEFCEKSRSGVQKRMLLILSNNEFLGTADLVRFSMGNYSALQALVKKGLVEFFDVNVDRNAYEFDGEIIKPPEPTLEQAMAINKISDSVEKECNDVFLLHGVTGSGKTEVFLRTIEKVVSKKRTALMLVPEISLTPQMVFRFVKRFGNRIAILHSGLSLGERYDQWHRIMNGDADIVIGARSAVFAPLDNIGIIIMDEEHSDTYKSEMAPRYHAKEIAMFRARQASAVMILASATPSMESYRSALQGDYKLLELKKRYNSNKMPDISIVDMRSELETGNKSMFSKTLFDELTYNLEHGEQSILFMNRRGYSTFVSCRKCGFVPMCPNCNISLTYHSFDNSLKCHYCGYKHANYRNCPACGSKYIRYFGGGTQRVEDEVKRLFPHATTIRLDADVTGRKNAHKEILDAFVKEKKDILIGTQMVAKGLDFANVTLVGVMSADTMLHLNDFRSGERTFDMLEQVSGRAGRGNKHGRAVIQTYDPDHFAIKLVKSHDYISFYKKTCSERREMWYPPFCEMICIRLTDTDNEVTRGAAGIFRDAFGNINEIKQKIAILGPIPAGVSKIQNRYRWQILIKCDNADALNDRILRSMECVRNQKKYSAVQISVDKNPISIY